MKNIIFSLSILFSSLSFAKVFVLNFPLAYDEIASKVLYNSTVKERHLYIESESDGDDPVSFRSPVAARITCFYKLANGATCHISSLDSRAEDLYEQAPLVLSKYAELNQSALKAVWNYVVAVGQPSGIISGAVDAIIVCSAGAINKHMCFVK